MPQFKLRFEPGETPRMSYQDSIVGIATDLDRMVVERDDIHQVINWTLALFRTVYRGAERMGPVKPRGGAIIDLGDMGELLIQPMQ